MVYFTPRSLDEALDLASEGTATVLAGGTDLYPAAGASDLPQPVLDISRLAELDGIADTADGWTIGALTRWSRIRDHPFPPAFDGLRAAAAQVGGVQIQNAGTVAGNLCNASPAADGVPPLLTLEAEVELASRRGRHRVALADFLKGPRATARAADEIVTALHLPHPPEDARAAFEKLGARHYLVISIAMAACLLRLDRTGRIAEARVAVGACSPVARRLTALESDLPGQKPEAADVTPAHLAPLAPIDDARGTAAYRLDAAAEIVRRALARAGSRDG